MPVYFQYWHTFTCSYKFLLNFAKQELRDCRQILPLLLPILCKLTSISPWNQQKTIWYIRSKVILGQYYLNSFDIISKTCRKNMLVCILKLKCTLLLPEILQTQYQTCFYYFFTGYLEQLTTKQCTGFFDEHIFSWHCSLFIPSRNISWFSRGIKERKQWCEMG